MSPLFLYPVYFAAKLFGWTGLGVLAFHVLLAFVILWAVWELVGRDHFAVITAIVTVLCPGYLRWPRDFDPGALSVLPILPYAVIALALLKKPRLTPGIAAALFVLTLGMVSLNWTSAWACAPFIFWILAMPGINRRGMIFLIAAMVFVIPTLAFVSVAAKYGHSAQTGGGVLGSYTWGNTGYGTDLSASRAFIRIGFANVIGLFPLWLVLVYAVRRRIQAGTDFSLKIFSPLAMAIADLIMMRNYFGHHPWMAGPVLIVGIIFSLALLRIPEPKTKEEFSFKLMPALGLGGFAYGLAVLIFLRTNENELLALAQLVRQNTARSDTIVLERSDSRTTALADRLAEVLDRRVIVVNDLQDLAGQKEHWVILSATKLNGPLPLVAQSAEQSQSSLAHITDWFNHTVARRKPGDRLEVSDAYFLYESKLPAPH
jgi:hypothetical protein